MGSREIHLTLGDSLHSDDHPLLPYTSVGAHIYIKFHFLGRFCENIFRLFNKNFNSLKFFFPKFFFKIKQKNIFFKVTGRKTTARIA